MGHFDKVSDLLPGTENPKIRVKCLQKWSDGVGANRKIRFILADIEGDKIHGFIPRNLVTEFNHKIVKGGVILIKDFIVRTDFATYRPTKSAFKIILTSDTNIRTSRQHWENNFFEFAEYQNINSRIQPDGVYIDLIGTVVNIGSLQTDTRNMDRLDDAIIPFDMRSQDGVIVECFATGLAAFNLLYDWQHFGGNRNVCILRFWSLNYLNPKAKVYNREDCADIIFNANFPEIHEIRTSLINFARSIEPANGEETDGDD